MENHPVSWRAAAATADTADTIYADDKISQEYGLSNFSVLSDVFSGVGTSIKEHVDGLRQIGGAKVDLSYAHDLNTPEKIGAMIGESAMFIGAGLLARKLPGLSGSAGGKLAGCVAGGAMGLTMPLEGAQRSSGRLLNGMLGAGTMGILEFGPGLSGKLPGISRLGANSCAGSFARVGVASGLAGLVNSETNSFIATGRGASIPELAAGTGTWMLMGGAFHALGTTVAKIRQQRAEAHAWESQKPWQYKEVIDIEASDLEPGQRLSAGHYNIGYTSQGAPRRFNLYISDRAASKRDAPLVTFLHGLSRNGESGSAIRELEFNRMADEAGAVVAYPQAKPLKRGFLSGAAQSWNDRNFGFLSYDSSYSDVVAFQDMVEVISSHAPYVDTKNIAVSGFSLGGKMAHRVAANLESVRVLSTIHSTIDLFDKQIIKMAKQRHSIDVQVIHGNKDSVLPFGGGKSFFTAFLENANLSKPRQQAEFWAASNRQIARQSRLGANYAPQPQARQLYQSEESPGFFSRKFESPDGHVVREVVAKDAPHRINGAQAVYDLIQMATGLPLPPTHFDARQLSWEFLIASLRRRALESLNH